MSRDLEIRVLEAILLEGKKIPKKFYHGSSLELEHGKILGGKRFKSNFGDVEKVLEKFRPPEMNSRLNSVFLVSTPSDVYTAGGSDSYIYLVEPIGNIQAHHQGWLGEIYNIAMKNADELTRTGPKLLPATMKRMSEEFKELANNYWHGKDYKKGGVWEYLSTKAKIIRKVRK